MACPVCGAGVVATFTRPGRRYKGGVMLCCPGDSRHFRAFVNDPVWVDRAASIGDAGALIGVEHGRRSASEWGPGIRRG